MPYVLIVFAIILALGGGDSLIFLILIGGLAWALCSM